MAALPLLAGTEHTEAQPPERAEDYRFDVWRTEDGLPLSSVAAVLQDRQGYLWVGTQEGLARFDGQRFEVYDKTSSEAIRGNFVTALLEAHDGTLWFGTYDGLHRLSGGRIEAFGIREGLADEAVEDLEIDPQGRLWIATRGGLSRFDSTGFKTFRRTDGLPHDRVNAVETDTRGTLWIGTQDGLARFDGALEAPAPIRGLESPYVVALLAERDAGRNGSLWVGTDNGLYRLRNGRAEAVAELADAAVLALLEDRDGCLWAGTQRGLFRFYGETVLRISTDHGLAGKTVLSLFEDNSDALWVGTFKGGLNRLRRPAGERLRPLFLPVVIEEVEVAGGRTFLPAVTDALPPGSSDLELRYTAIRFDHPERVSFQYRLEGYDDDLVDAGGRRFAHYTNLPPSDYRFHVKAFDPEVGQTEASYSFTLLPRLYQTRTFAGLCALGLAALLYGVYRLWVGRLLAQRHQLERAVERRTAELERQTVQLADAHRQLNTAFQKQKQTNQELKALYREKSDFLAIAAHDLRAPLVNLKGFALELRTALLEAREAILPALAELPPEERASALATLDQELPEALDFINASAHQLEHLIGPILKLSRLSRRPLIFQPLDLGSLVEGLLETLEERMPGSREVVHVETMPPLTADSSSIKEILEELLTNALNFLDPARPGHVEVTGERNDRETVLEIRDNGRGIGEEESSRVFRIFGHTGREPHPGRGMGLVYVRTLIHRHGGRIWYRSRPGEGTTFTFTIPHQQEPAV